MTQSEIKALLDDLMLIVPTFAFLGGWFMGWWMRGDIERRNAAKKSRVECPTCHASVDIPPFPPDKDPNIMGTYDPK